nr:hypothetical protein [Tanacetum cinerariifolium]
SKLRHLKKVGTSQRVESSEDVENVFNQGRKSVDMETNEGIDLEVDQEKCAEVEGRQADTQAKIYNIDLDHSSKVLSMQEDTKVQEAVEIVTTAKLITEVVTAAATQVEMDAEYARKLQEELNKEHEESFKNIDWNAVFDHVQAKETQYIKRYHGFKKKPQSKSEARKNMISYLRNTEGYKMEFFKGLKKVPVVNYEIMMINNKPRYKIFRADDTHQLYTSFITLLKNFDREDLEDLWKIVKARFSTSKPTNFSNDYLLSTLKTMFEKTDGQDVILRSQQTEYGQALVKS